MPLHARERAAAVVTMLEGSVLFFNEIAWQPVQEKQRILAKTTLKSSSGSRVLLQFRDGSWLRLFENSRFSLTFESSPKSPTEHFERNWLLQQGSMLASLVPGRQLLMLNTPNSFKVQIKEGVLSMFQKENETVISLSRGSAQVRNARSFVKMKEGQWLDRVGPGDLLSEKIKELPNFLRLEALPDKTIKSGGQSYSLKIRIQLSRRLLNRDIRLGGPVLLSGSTSSYPIPRQLILNNRGTAEVNIPIATSLIDDPGFGGWINLMVSMDSVGYSQVAAGFGDFQVVHSKP